jgi:hypothetical protein
MLVVVNKKPNGFKSYYFAKNASKILLAAVFNTNMPIV